MYERICADAQRRYVDILAGVQHWHKRGQVLLLCTVKALGSCSISTCGVEGGLQRKRAEDPILRLVLGVREANGERLGHSAVLDPRAHLVKDGGRLPTSAARAVLEPGNFEDAEEVVDVGEHLGDGLVVVSRALGRDVWVRLGGLAR